MMSHILPGLWLKEGLRDGSHTKIAAIPLTEPKDPFDASHPHPSAPSGGLLAKEWGPLTLTLQGDRLSLSHASLAPWRTICSNGVLYFADSLLVPRH